jgi:hypothetical protein
MQSTLVANPYQKGHAGGEEREGLRVEVDLAERTWFAGIERDAFHQWCIRDTLAV